MSQKPELTEDTIAITLEDHTEVECDILAVFEVDRQFYVALLPQTPIEGYEEGEYFLYRYFYDGTNISLSDLETEEEWEKVEDKFEELLDEEEFNNMSE